jgi:hypothetical protein
LIDGDGLRVPLPVDGVFDDERRFCVCVLRVEQEADESFGRDDERFVALAAAQTHVACGGRYGDFDEDVARAACARLDERRRLLAAHRVEDDALGIGDDAAIAARWPRRMPREAADADAQRSIAAAPAQRIQRCAPRGVSTVDSARTSVSSMPAASDAQWLRMAAGSMAMASLMALSISTAASKSGLSSRYASNHAVSPASSCRSR